MTTPEGRLARAVVMHLTARKWGYVYDPVERVYSTTVRLRGFTHLLDFRLEEARELLTIFNTLPLEVPEPRREAMADFICRMNFGLRMGCAEMDSATGLLRFKLSTSFAGTVGELSQHTMKLLSSAALYTMGIYLPGMYRVIAGACDPEEAVGACERADASGWGLKEMSAAEGERIWGLFQGTGSRRSEEDTDEQLLAQLAALLENQPRAALDAEGNLLNAATPAQETSESAPPPDCSEEPPGG